MPKAQPAPEKRGLAPNDPRRPLMLKRLKALRARVDEFLRRDPALEDPAFKEWEDGVRSVLIELFGESQYLLRFRNLNPRPISYYMGGAREWHSDPQAAWQAELKRAANLLDEAIEEGELDIPIPAQDSEPRSTTAPAVSVTINNQNIFSAAVHISISQTLEKLEQMDLSSAEKAIAAQHLEEIDTETKGAGRWPIIARAVENLKSIGVALYKDLAVPLLVEYLKRESGLS
jgi:hypothetical protein